MQTPLWTVGNNIADEALGTERRKDWNNFQYSSHSRTSNFHVAFAQRIQAYGEKSTQDSAYLSKCGDKKKCV